MSNLIICEHQVMQCCNRVVINQPDVSGLAWLCSPGLVCWVDGVTLTCLRRTEHCSQTGLCSAGSDMRPKPLIPSAEKSFFFFFFFFSSAVQRLRAAFCFWEGGGGLESRDVSQAFSFAVNNSSLRPVHWLSSCGMAHVLQDEYEGSL